MSSALCRESQSRNEMTHLWQNVQREDKITKPTHLASRAVRRLAPSKSSVVGDPDSGVGSMKSSSRCAFQMQAPTSPASLQRSCDDHGCDGLADGALCGLPMNAWPPTVLGDGTRRLVPRHIRSPESSDGQELPRPILLLTNTEWN